MTKEGKGAMAGHCAEERMGRGGSLDARVKTFILEEESFLLAKFFSLFLRDT